ncbi:MAG TPA: 1,4-dihydroxy-2-naphthoate polyprenyltransferase [Thermoanaerobaculia bacterium]|nr:1,4-dihydroxy-2-naphthoate polyprenyltransferase [Thermoanaerobaculia bacterium]
MRNWILAVRPKTLTAAVIPVIVGTSLAAGSHTIVWKWFVLALLGALFIQIGTNLINDVADFRKGTDTAERLGPLRVTQAGLLTETQVVRGAIVAFSAAVLCGIPLVLHGGAPLFVIGVTSLAAGYAYTAGPWPLAYHGWGDFFVIVFFGVVAVSGSYFLQTKSIDTGSILAGVSVGCLAAVLIAINNLRDRDGDLASDKKTLAVRFGSRFARVEITTLALAPFAIGSWWLQSGYPLPFYLPLLALPLAWAIIRSAHRDAGSALNTTLGKAAALHALHGILFSLGVAIQ